LSINSLRSLLFLCNLSKLYSAKANVFTALANVVLTLLYQLKQVILAIICAFYVLHFKKVKERR
jgi:hypothetical protein